MNYNQIKVFLEAARTRSFTVTAENLFMSQQSVSNQIINLERELGHQLFKRSRRGLELTREGAYYNDFFTTKYSAERKCSETPPWRRSGEKNICVWDTRL